MSTFDVVVLGAGPAGLGAAYRLSRAGRRVCVLERDDRVGGLAASFEVAGQRVDHGSHRLHPATAEPVMATLRELLGADLQRRPRRGRIRMAGRFVRFPPRPFDLVTHLPAPLSARLALDMATSPLRRAHDDTFDEVVRASLGPTLAQRFYGPYVEKIFGVPAPQLAGELARRRVGTRTAADLLKRVVRPTPERGWFSYPRRGFGQIPEVLADAAVAHGAHVRTGAEVVAVDAGPGGVEVRVAGGEVVEAGHVWTTLPLPLLARIAAAPDDVRAAAGRLETRGLVLVYLALPASRWSAYDAHYFPEPGVPMSRVSEPKNYRESADDPRDVTVLCAELPCRAGDELWGAAPSDLAETVRDALFRSELATPAPVHVEVRRVPRAYPVYRSGFEDAFETVDAWASRVPRLLHFGRQGLFAHDNTHHALATAWAAADAFRGGDVDRARWAESRRAFRSHVVED